jgi:DNA-binding Lrp family transcriptional regulator
MNEIKLLQALENNARIDLKDLCDELNQNEYKVNEELSRLEEANIICGYHTVINWDKTNKENVTALIEVGATPKRDSGYDDIAKKIYRYPEVSTMYLMSGKMEFIVVINGKSMREVADFVARKLAPIEGVNKTETYFVLKQYKVEGVVLDEEEREFKRQIVSL